jgi:hypothetical protein
MLFFLHIVGDDFVLENMKSLLLSSKSAVYFLLS